MNKELIISIVVGLDDIELFLQLLLNLHNLLRIAPTRDGVFVNAVDTRRRHIETLDVNLYARKHVGNLVKDAGNVLAIY